METLTSPTPFAKTQGGEQPGDDANADEERSRNCDALGLFRKSSGLRLLEDLLEGALCDGICRAGTCCISSRPRTPRTALYGDEAMHDVWYFTFGANMHAKTLARRGVGTVLESLTGSLPDYRLAFTYEGYEGCEPRFANIEPLGKGGVPVQGVAHRLSRKQMKLLDGFEGEGSAYERATVTFVAAAAAAADALGEMTRPSASFEVQAYVAKPSHTAPPGLPSKRYVKLLADGASAHGLAAEYVAMIRAQPIFDCEGVSMPQPPVGARDVSFAELQHHGYREEGVRSLLFANGGRGEAEAQSHSPRVCVPYKVLRLTAKPPTEAEVRPLVNTPAAPLQPPCSASTAPLHLCTSAPLHLCTSAPLQVRARIEGEVRARMRAEREAEAARGNGGADRGGKSRTKGESDDEGEGEELGDKGVWVAMGGLVFDVTSAVRNICAVFVCLDTHLYVYLYSIFDGCQAHGRAMLRSMSGGDGTRVVLRMWLAAYGSGDTDEVARLEAVRTVRVEALPPAQREYVASWAQHLVARYPCVGVLRVATAGEEQGCTLS
jgi:hypothetical protein